VDRRSVLTAAGTLTAALAGCSTLDSGASRDVTHLVWVTNAHEESQEVAARLTRDGTVLVDETRTLDSDEEWDIGEFTERGSYELTIRAVGEERRDFYDLPMVSESNETVPYESYAEGTITPGGELELQIYRTAG